MSDDDNDDMIGLGLDGPEPPVPVERVRADALRRANTAWAARVAGAAWAEAAKIAGYGSDTAAIDGVRNVYGWVPVIDREALRHL